jgi:hypothetical protein
MHTLALSVINDPASYDARRHAASKLLQGYHGRAEFASAIRAICNDKARAERVQFGVKIKAADITAQAGEVAENALSHARDTIRAHYTGERCHAVIRRWWDKANGNSYYSVSIRIPQDGGGFTLYKVPFDYGYGSHPEWETITALVGLGLFERAEHDAPGSYPVDFEDQGYMKKGML